MYISKRHIGQWNEACRYTFVLYKEQNTSLSHFQLSPAAATMLNMNWHLEKYQREIIKYLKYS